MDGNRLQNLPLQNVKICDDILSPYIDLVKKEIIPYQWKALNDQLEDTTPSHSIENFKIAAGEAEGEFHGEVFQDSDVAKWLEAVAYSLSTEKDDQLEQTADEVIELLGRAQQPDGYLDTYFIIKEPGGRWKNLKEGHELYCAGHMIEAAVAYYEATGKDRFLKIVCKMADLIADVFLNDEAMKTAYPGHEEIELALVRLYHTTKNRTYLELAKHFVDVRGVGENYFLKEEQRPDFRPIWNHAAYDPKYSQSHLPVREQTTAEGHAVRAVYLYTAMADLAAEYQDETLLHAVDTLWNDMIRRRMYINGSIGSSGINERFTTDYDLPNDANYSESCASVGLAMFGKRMAQITKDASYMDAVELALYNTVLAGIAADGKSFFYVNPMEVWPENCMPATSREHVKPVRQKWFGCACCPPNIARTLASFSQYTVFTEPEKNSLYLNMYVGSEIRASLKDADVSLSVTGNFPESGISTIQVQKCSGTSDGVQLKLRIPCYADQFKVTRNGQPCQAIVEHHYFVISNVKESDVITVQANIPVRVMHANPKVRADEGKAALMKGPILYCLEEVDNFKNLSSVYIPSDPEITADDVHHLHFNGKRIVSADWDDSQLYQCRPVTMEDVSLTAVPYYSWGNRTHGEMLVWMKELLS